MARYILRRLAESMVVLAVMSFVIYALIGLMPGDPIDLMLSADPHLMPADAERLEALMGIDQPLMKRYLAWVAAAITLIGGTDRHEACPFLREKLPRSGL